MRSIAFVLAGSFLNLSCASFAQAPGSGFTAGPSMQSDPQIVTTLLQLMDVKDNTRPTNDDYKNTALKDLITLGTPMGYHLRNRYMHLGIPLAEALAPTEDPRLHDQMLELARWDRYPEIRSIGLSQLAVRKDPEAGKWCNEAVNNPDPAVRWGGMEALMAWNKDPDVKQILERVMLSDNQPILKVFAAQALLRRGDDKGREYLLQQLDSSDWLAKAMAARYLGDFGIGDDYDLMLDRMGREQTNNFVVAEMAIAALKLFPKKEAPETPATTPAAVSPTGEDELDPLIVTKPRLPIPATALIDTRINVNLLRLLQTPDWRPTQDMQQNPSVQTLNNLVSPAGFLLKIRYTELAFLLTEGLAGSSDLLLRQQILSVAHAGTNSTVRAAAIMALAYNQDQGDRGMFMEAINSQDFTLRFAAVEGLEVWGKEGAMEDIGNVSRLDPSMFLQVYAAGVLLRRGDASGRDTLIRHWDDPDWVVRSLAIRTLGKFGVAEDYPRILQALSNEHNNFVKAEMAGALMRLARLQPK
ncbi:MAG: HEAT repeat domain-containing protein [Elusimicrobia bacterium]|nr:HEAT repeat domain-containing protein [Elusimicrobiota bacterium]